MLPRGPTPRWMHWPRPWPTPLAPESFFSVKFFLEDFSLGFRGLAVLHWETLAAFISEARLFVLMLGLAITTGRMYGNFPLLAQPHSCEGVLEGRSQPAE